MCNCGTQRGADLAPVETKPAAGALNRRVVLKAAAGLSAMAAAVASGGQTARPSIIAAQENGGTRATRWSPVPSIDAKAGENGDATADGFRVFQTDYPFFALGASWSAEVGLWPIVEVQVSADGETWSDSFQMMADTEDGGRPTREDRLFTPLIFTDGTNWVRFRTIDSDGNAGSVDGLAFTYIDASDGPWEQDVADAGSPAPGDADTDVPPRLLSREAWGADESYRYDADGEIWPPTYELVHHIIIHHTDTPTYQDPLVAIRSIYYYHAVDQGWGDIGYNYLVDRNGTIYEGRYGGQNTVGGHSYQYAYGSSGICIIGDYQNQLESDAARAGLVQIVAWVGRDLDPYGAQDFLDVPDLPVICAHRDVNSTACPGDMLYGDLPAIRDLVAATLDSGSLDTGNPGGIAIRDRVIVQTDDGADLNVRESGSASAAVVGSLANGTPARVIDGPQVGDNDNWYEVDWGNGTGWVVARYLIVSPPEPVEGAYDYAFGTNLEFRTSANLRGEPSTDAGVVADVPKGEWAAVLDGPVSGGEYDWYQVQTQNHGSGWVAKNFITSAATDDNPGGDFGVGDTVEATESVNLRARPGVAQAVWGTIPAGTRMQISQPPFWVTDYRWYGVQGEFGAGWVVGNMLKAT